jgi:hypothetical protein
VYQGTLPTTHAEGNLRQFLADLCIGFQGTNVTRARKIGENEAMGGRNVRK